MFGKTVLLEAALLLCLAVLIHPAMAGSGCGTNWLGSDSNDQDFWVSKNQNSDVSGANEKAPESSTTKPQITDLVPDTASPQAPGSTIVWRAEATAPQMDQVRYKFLLRGPSTEGAMIDQTGWTSNNTWVWETGADDVGQNEVEVRIKYGQNLETDGFDASKKVTFTIEEAGSEQKTEDAEEEQVEVIDPNPHPPSRTGTFSQNKPRIAPDERPRAYPSANKVNMSMPDPTPKPLVSEEETGEAPVDTYVPVEETEPPVQNIAGKWSVQLQGSAGYLDLILIQSGSMIMGSGNLVDGQNKIPVTVSGSVSGDEVSLEVKTVVREFGNQIDKSYEMDLEISDGSLTGSYEGYDGDNLSRKGVATAGKTG